MEFTLIRIFSIIICLFFNPSAVAEETYLTELKSFIAAFKPVVDITKELSSLSFDKSTENEIEFRAAMNKCVLNDLDRFYEKSIPTFKKYYSISELQNLTRSLQSKEGKVYLDYIGGIIVSSSLTPKEVEAINMIWNTKEVLKLEPFFAELSEKTEEYALPFRDYCLKKYLPEK